MADMGIGRLGQPQLIFKRKFRWQLSIKPQNGSEIEPHYVKLANRPALDIDELEINYLNGTTWVPGRARWQQLNVTYIDVASAEMSLLYSWMATHFDFSQQNQRNHITQSERQGWESTATLKMFDACGQELEQWVMEGVWPVSVNFGDLDYSSSDECNIELTLRYDTARHTATCGPTANANCRGCQSGGGGGGLGVAGTNLTPADVLALNQRNGIQPIIG